MSQARTPSSRSEGFSLTELLVVVAIIAIMAAVSLPAIGRYIRNYKIRGATQEVAGELQAARAKAINKNVNLGVVFLTTSSTSYRWLIEDDQNPNDADKMRMTRIAVSSLIPSGPTDPVAMQAGPDRVLPAGIRFSTTCASTPVGGSWKAGVRFNRLGAACDPTGGEPCPALGAVGQPFVYNNATDSFICLEQPESGLTRWVRVRPGGRVMTQP